MGHELALTEPGFKKLHIAETVQFAVTHVPSVDRKTLETFLALVNTDGTFGSISAGQLVQRMRQLQKYVPRTCAHSLLVLADLLDLRNVAPPKPSPATRVRRGKPIETNRPTISKPASTAQDGEMTTDAMREQLKQHRAMPLGM